jgi:hypothetical protein
VIGGRGDAPTGGGATGGDGVTDDVVGTVALGSVVEGVVVLGSVVVGTVVGGAVVGGTVVVSGGGKVGSVITGNVGSAAAGFPWNAARHALPSATSRSVVGVVFRVRVVDGSRVGGD